MLIRDMSPQDYKQKGRVGCARCVVLCWVCIIGMCHMREHAHVWHVTCGCKLMAHSCQCCHCHIHIHIHEHEHEHEPCTSHCTLRVCGSGSVQVTCCVCVCVCVCDWADKGEQSDRGHTTRLSHKCTSLTFT